MKLSFIKNQLGINRQTIRLRSRRLILLLPPLVFVFLFLQNYSDWKDADTLNRILIRNQSSNAAEAILRQIGNFINEKCTALVQLAAAWDAASTQEKEALFRREASRLAGREDSCIALQFIDPQFSVRFSTQPDKRNPQPELDLETLPGRSQLFQEIVNFKNPLAAFYPVENSQKSILELCVPMVANRVGQSSFQGFISSLYQIDWLNQNMIPSSTRESFSFRIVLNKKVIYQSHSPANTPAKTFSDEEMTLAHDILNQRWSVVVCPSPKGTFANLFRTNLRNFAINASLSFLASVLLCFALLTVLRLQNNQRQLLLSEAHYRSLLDSARNYMVYRMAIDPSAPLHARVIFVSPSVKEILGIHDVENLAAWFETIQEDDLNSVIQEHFQCIETGKPFECTLRIHHRIKNELRWIDVKAIPIFGDDGKPIFFNGIMIDVTDARQSEEKLERSEKLYRDALGLINAAPYYQNYIDNCYEFVGEGIQSILGFSPDELTPSLWKSQILEMNLLNDLQHLSLEEALQKARGDEGFDWRADCRVKTRSGEERWIANAAVQVRNPAGNVVGSLGILQDITNRKQIESALRESEQKYRELVENANSIILRMDTQGTITYFNEFAQKFFGYCAEEILNQNAQAALFPKTRESDEIFTRILTELQPPLNRPSAKECENLRKNGERVWILWTSKPILNKNQELKEILCIGTDITELKKLQEQFRQAHKMEAIGRLAGGVAHDFNNLIMAILGFSDLALRTSQLDPALRKNLQEIRNVGERAASLTKQLLAFSRKQVVKPITFNLNALIVNMDKMLRRLIGEDIELVTIPGDSLGMIQADMGQMEQILLNLAINARDAMPGGGKLTIETANAVIENPLSIDQFNVAPGDYVLLTVCDAGEGIPKENLERIFDPFFTTKEHGAGLGLATVYGIVQQSGGAIVVQSEPNIGSAFKIYLPRTVAEPTPDRPKKPMLSPDDVSKTILLVEDESIVRHLVSRVLKRTGFTVLEAGYGDEALEICKHHDGPIHLLLTDVIMPKMSGRELAGQLVNMIPDLQVLYMSGYTDESIVYRKIIEEGVAFIQKPFTPDNLIHKLYEIFEIKRSRE